MEKSIVGALFFIVKHNSFLYIILKYDACNRHLMMTHGGVEIVLKHILKFKNKLLFYAQIVNMTQM